MRISGLGKIPRSLAAIIALALFIAGCSNGVGEILGGKRDEISFVNGTVLDGDGRPMAGVQIVGNTRTTTTDASGRWTMSGLTDEILLTPRLDKWRFEPTSRRAKPGAANLRFTGYRLGSSYLFNVTIEGPEHSYPIEGAFVRINGESAYTDVTGTAVMHHVNPDETDEPLEFTVKTDFYEHSWVESAPGTGESSGSGSTGTGGSADPARSRTASHSIPLPAHVWPEDLVDGIFNYGNYNFRWERGAEVTLFVRHYGSQYTSASDRRFLDDLAEASLEAWLQPAEAADPAGGAGPAGATVPYLVWGGRAHNEDDATLIIHLVHGSPVGDDIPAELENSTSLMRYDSRRIGEFSYRTRVEVWIAADQLPRAANVFHPFFGRAFGVSPFRSGLGRSVIYDYNIPEPTELDITLLRMKMHIPPLPYDPN